MLRRAKLWSWLIVGLLGLGLLIFIFGPVLLASVAYPLPQKHQQALIRSGEEFGVSPNFIAALIYTESGWRENAKSGAGAIGLTQVIPSTGRAIAEKLNVPNFNPKDLSSNPELSIRFGAYYIAEAVKRNGGNKQFGLIAYNGGQGAVLAYQRGYAIRGTVGYANKVISVERMYDRIYGAWWDRPDLPDLSSRSRADGLVTNIPILEFWTTLVFTQGIESEQTPADFNDFWKNLIPAP